MTYSAKARATAKSLAIAYAAYLRAEDDLSLVVWGPIVLQAQADMGVDMVDVPLTLARIEAAKIRRSTPEA